MPFRTRRRPPAGEPPSTDADACREAALRLLERTRRTRSDLARRLAERGFDPATVESVLGRLGDVGLVDDAEYARAFLAGRWGRRPSGWKRLQQELRARGVTDADVREARALIEEREGAVDELSAARRLVAQAGPRYAKLEPRARAQRLWALLARRGFDSDVIRRALDLREDEPPAD